VSAIILKFFSFLVLQAGAARIPITCLDYDWSVMLRFSDIAAFPAMLAQPGLAAGVVSVVSSIYRLAYTDEKKIINLMMLMKGAQSEAR
jgi:hypothetical protein